jgi:hypothetical protein
MVGEASSEGSEETSSFLVGLLKHHAIIVALDLNRLSKLLLRSSLLDLLNLLNWLLNNNLSGHSLNLWLLLDISGGRWGILFCGMVGGGGSGWGIVSSTDELSLAKAAGSRHGTLVDHSWGS